MSNIKYPILNLMLLFYENNIETLIMYLIILNTSSMYLRKLYYIIT